MIDSLVEQEGYTADSASWNVGIANLNAYTSSFAPSLSSLNAFTASQLVINNGVNVFTQSANSSISQLNTFSASFYAYTASINQIQSNGVTLGTSTRFNLVGPGTFFSASLVQNVGGPIATLTFSSDNAKLNTSSFNDYTASQIVTQAAYSASVSSSFHTINVWTASASSSIGQLLQFSSSLDATYATDAQLNYSASVLQSNIDTNKSAFNSYTASQNSLNATYATTGSNTFKGAQTIDDGGAAPYGLQVLTNNAYIQGGIVTDSSISVRNQYGNITFARNAEGSGSQYAGGTIYVDPAEYQADGVYSAWGVADSVRQATIISLAANSYSKYYPETVGGIFGGGLNADGNDSAIILRTGSATMEFDKPTRFSWPMSVTGSVTITGSVYQNVIAVPTVSSTASIDLSKGSYFTLTMGGTTKINVINAQPGITATLVISTSNAASASFSSNVKQPSGSFYAASPSGNIDIISFTAVNSNTVYAFPAQSFI
jgi:hypothetical protein